MSITNLDSQHGVLKQSEQYGMWSRMIVTRTPTNTSAATTSTGYVSLTRYNAAITVPSHAGFDGWLASAEGLGGVSNTSHIMALEYDLGSINIGTGTFTAGVSMPTKAIRSAGATYSEQTASMLVVAVVTTPITGLTTPLSITYTNQNGTGSRSASLGAPGTTVDSAYLLQPHLQSGDTGVRSVENITKTTGTGGVIALRGLLPLSYIHLPALTLGTNQPLSSMAALPVLCESGETIAFYRFGATTNSYFIGEVALRPI